LLAAAKLESVPVALEVLDAPPVDAVLERPRRVDRQRTAELVQTEAVIGVAVEPAAAHDVVLARAVLDAQSVAVLAPGRVVVVGEEVAVEHLVADRVGVAQHQPGPAVVVDGHRTEGVVRAGTPEEAVTGRAADLQPLHGPVAAP